MANSALYNRLFGGSGSFKGGAKKKGVTDLLKLLNDKKQFLILVFANLIVQLGITYYTFMKTPEGKITHTEIIIMFIVNLILIWGLAAPSLPSWLKFILFCVFSILQGFIISIIKTKTNDKMIQVAISGAISIFVFMAIFALALAGFGVYLSTKIGVILFLLLLCLIIFELISMLAGTFTTMQKGFAFIGLLLFSSYVIYDTSNILQRNYYGDFITASFDYYLDVINIALDIFTLNNN